MTRRLPLPLGSRRLALTACLVAVALGAACGGGSSASSRPAKLEPGDIAVVGSTHITKRALDHQIALEVRSLRLGAESCTGGSQGREDCTETKGAIPAIGTPAYATTVVQPVIRYLVAQAKLRRIARQLHVVVTPREIGAEVGRAVKRLYGGSQARYRADLARHAMTQADAAEQVEFTLLERGIDARLRSQVHVTPAQVRAYFDSHRTLYETDATTRRVDYVLLPSRAAAVRARRAIAAGKSFAAVDTGAIDDSSRHEPYTATGGRVDRAFAAAAFGLRTDALSQPVRADRAYARRALKGRCRPACYFVIRPTAALVRGGTELPFSAVRGRIASQLLTARQTIHVQDVIERLEKVQARVTRYAAGYAPGVALPSTGVPDQDDDESPVP